MTVTSCPLSAIQSSARVMRVTTPSIEGRNVSVTKAILMRAPDVESDGTGRGS